MARRIIGIIAIVFVLGVSIWGFQAAIDNAGVDHSIDDETFTPDAGNVTELNHSNLDHTSYDEAVSVFDSNGNLVNPDEDYEWVDDNGTIKAVEGGDLHGEPSASIDYRYQTTTTDQRALASIANHIPRVLAAIVPFLGVALLFAFLRG